MIDQQAPLIAGLLGLPRVPLIDMSYEEGVVPEGMRVIDAEAEAERIIIRYEGSWTTQSPEARRGLVRNLAHELAHVWQRTLGLPVEGQILHEGFAEAIAVEALLRCGASCDADAAGLIGQWRRLCADALRQGYLINQTSREASYGCGTVMVRASAKQIGIDSRELYRRFAATGERELGDFFAVLGEGANDRAAFSARAFLQHDHRLANPETVMENLAAGRL